MTSTTAPSRTWLLIGGAIALVVGLFALAAPLVFSYVLTAFVGAFLLVNGIASLFQSLFGKGATHRVLSAIHAVVRIAAGTALFVFTGAGMAALTLILAAVFAVEGVVCIATSIRMRSNPAWIWLGLNGVAALVLAGMIYSKWPLDADWVIGVLYGIQSIFSGVSLILLGLNAKPGAAQ